MSRRYIIRGLLFGDEGKGTITDYVSMRCGDTIKDGGPQAAHHIISRSGNLHRSEQMGSSVFNAGVRTFGSKNMFVSPDDLIEENTMLHLAGVHDGMKRFSIDSRCPIVTPLHRMIGRLKETVRGKGRHGSTGKGVGEAVRDRKEKGNEVLIAGDMNDESVLNEKIGKLFADKFRKAEEIYETDPRNERLSELYRYYCETMSSKQIFDNYRHFVCAYPECIVDDGEEYFSQLLRSDNELVFEGAQGALLDPEYGFVPHVTKTKTTFGATLELLNGRVPESRIEKIGVLRAYATRHGAGPFVAENSALSRMIPDMHNRTNPWQGKFRIGWFDLVAARYGILVNEGVDSVALTNLDRLSRFSRIKVCTSYEYLGKNESDLDEFFEWEYSGSRIRITELKKPYQPQSEKISKILFECKPLDYAQFPGWKTGIANAKTRGDLPKEAIGYLDFLQGEEGLGSEISIVSVGPTSDNKIQYNSC